MNRHPNSQPLKAGLGRHVTLELVTAEGVERLELEIVPDPYADFELGFLGASTPLAKAITGLAAGQTAPYRLGDASQVRVLAVEPARSPPPKQIAERRQENLRKALDQADRTNAMIFASSFTGKWGDYDPTGFEEDSPPEDSEEGTQE